MASSSGSETKYGGRALTSLMELIQAGRPLIYVLSPEEERVLQMLQEVSRRLFSGGAPVWTWSLTGGLQRTDGSPRAVEALDARSVLEFISAHEGPGFFQLRDYHEYLGASPEIRRRVRDLYSSCLDVKKYVLITSPVPALPDELSHQVAFLELYRPDHEELIDFLRRESAVLSSQGTKVALNEQSLYRMAGALQGLTIEQSRHALRRALALSGSLDEGSVPHLLDEKKLIVNRSGLVHFVSDGTRLDHVGGLEYLKEWLLARRKLFMQRDSLEAEIVPKGVLIMGVSGCGKSLSVKAIAECFHLPLYRIDMIEVFSGQHGNPDRAFVEACGIVESVAPAVVWFDEIEMGLTAQSGEASRDQGRLFAFFLTWMQEKPRGLFVAATANRIDLLPAEMIRKGRFDEVFFIDLPGDEERSEIFRIHLKKRGIDPNGLQINRLKIISQAWSGAEIEQCVVSAMTAARLEDRQPVFEDLHRAAQNIIPLSKTMREQVDHIRSWAYDRAVRASPR